MIFKNKLFIVLLVVFLISTLTVNVFAATVAELMYTATEPIGKCLYVYGGGWNEPDTGAGKEAMQLGLGQNWQNFYNSKNSKYDYNTTRYQIHDGLDCTGYVGWCMYQLFQDKYSKEGYVYLAKEMAQKYSTVFNGKFTAKANVKKRQCGDIMSSNGHAYIVVGECPDGSVVLFHASPPAVSLCGTATPGGNKQSEAVRLANFYMNIFFNECYTKYPNCSRGTDYLTSYNQMSWDSSVLNDPDGYRQMNAEDILRDMFYKTKIYLNGERIAKDKNVYNVNSTTFVPVRVICEKLGLRVDWNNGKIKLIKDNTTVDLQVESDVAVVNGVATKLNYNVFLVDNTSYVPLRLISEAFGLSVAWDDFTKSVIIN
ncbi:MAG: copper amine oxidase N-terminal domain-containing protein [Ruminococcaceae bacterium]|nr:copper amine oxidase N-terminal domain-containing protein [Oscillospiraceae bacterium]